VQPKRIEANLNEMQEIPSARAKESPYSTYNSETSETASTKYVKLSSGAYQSLHSVYFCLRRKVCYRRSQWLSRAALIVLSPGSIAMMVLLIVFTRQLGDSSSSGKLGSSKHNLKYFLVL